MLVQEFINNFRSLLPQARLFLPSLLLSDSVGLSFLVHG